MTAPTSILVFRNGSIGNTLMAVPALRALRHSFPNARITIIVDQLGNELLQHCPYVDEIVVYEKHSIDAGLTGFLRIVKRTRQVDASHAILFKRFFRNGLIAFLSGAKTRAGFATDGKAPFLNLTIPYDLQTHIAHLNLKLVELIGAQSRGDELEVFLSADDHSFAELWCRERSLVPDNFICAHYGGVSVGSEFMPTEMFGKFLNKHRAQRRVVLIGSGGTELQHAFELSKVVSDSVLAVNLPLRTAIAIMIRAAGFAGFNSGPAHLAAACKLPGLVIFPNDVFQKDGVRWRPLTDTLRIYPARRDLSDSQWLEWIENSPPLIA